MLLSPGSFDALLFDLGRVVIDFDLNRAFAHWAIHAGCLPEELTRRFTVDDAYRRHERGEIEDTVFFSELRNSLRIDISDEQFLTGWNAIFIEEMPEIEMLLQRAAQRAPLYAFSNTNPSHIAYLTSRFATILSNFQQLFLSSSIGMRKPEAAAFDHVIKSIGVPAHRIVFFDDLVGNIEGARSRGITAVHVRTTADIFDTFAALGIE
jgi:HAD superfamily hydrolase (TIGR01509 family)